MKKSELTVSMPLTTYEELIAKSEELTALENKLRDCYDTNTADGSIRFDYEQAERVAREFIPYSKRTAPITF